MKYSLILSLILLFIFPKVIASQSNKAVLTLKDGTELSGYGKLRNFSKVKFKKSKNATPVDYKFNVVEKIEITKDDGVETYVFLPIKGKGKPKALQQLVKGKVSLYRIRDWHAYDNGGIKDKYYLRRGEGDVVLFISSDPFSRSFKKAGSKYFKDCSSLVQKIKKKEFKKKNIEEAVKYYNSKCN